MTIADDLWGGTNTVPAPPHLITADETPLAGYPEADEWARQENAATVAAVDQAIADRLASAELHEYIRLRALHSARQRWAKEQAGEIDVPNPTDLPDLLAEEDEDVAYRIDELWPRNGNVVLAAAYKSGKTTAVGNLIRCLADGDRFLGVYKVDPVTEGTIGLIDFEMPRRKLKQWLGEQGIRNRSIVKVWSMRGRARTFDLLNPEIRAKWVMRLRDANVKVWLIDCLGPILSALGLAEKANEEVGPILDALMSVATEAGVDEILLVHHMGHGAERSRGASRLRDWPDAEWRMVRQRNEENPLAEAAPDAPRFFAAFGRDVDVREGRLLYDPATRRLVYAEGSRREATSNAALTATLTFVRDNIGRSGRDVETAVTASGVARGAAREALKTAVAQNYVQVQAGPHRASLHVLLPSGFEKLAALTAIPADGSEPDDPWGPEVLCALGCGSVVHPDDLVKGVDKCRWC